MTDFARSRGNGLLVLAWVGFFASFAVMVSQTIGYEIVTLAGNGALLAVGTIIVLRKPGNAIGWILVVLGASWMVIITMDVVAESLAAADRTAAASWIALVAAMLTIPLIWLFAAMWLLFPDGRTTSRATRRLLRFSAIYALIATVASVFATPEVLGPGSAVHQHPFLESSLADSILEIETPFIAVIFLLGFVAAGMLIARVRRSGPIERRQIGWVAVAVIVYIALTLVNAFYHPLGSAEERAFLVLDMAASLVVALAMGVAIMRYRLYNIDWIINRSVTYGALAIFIGGVYIAIVVGLGELLGGESSFALSIVASVLVAMAFQPVRRRVELWANRLVYGDRATPYEVLVRFSRRSTELSDEELLRRIPRLIVDGTGASQAALWVRAGDTFLAASAWPQDATSRRIAGNGTFVDPDGDVSLPVLHDGELLGGISLVKTRGDTITPPEEALLTNLASGMGLALRNARLTAQLRNQVAALEASRERILVSADQARQALEIALDSGPQQQLVALKVKLGPVRVMAERAEATKTATLLTKLEADAGDAIKAVRDFAGGVYPPLLEAEGLTAAITQQTQKAAIPIAVHGDGVKRYGRDTEAAVYFAILEALQNTAKYSEAESASVSLADTGRQLVFEIRDKGRGFDPGSVRAGAGLTGMADRLDTVGGTLRIDSRPGEGTVVAGSVPANN